MAESAKEQSDLRVVEKHLRDHPSVDEAAVIFKDDDDGEDFEIVGFVTLPKHALQSQVESLGKSGGDFEKQQVQLWDTVFDRNVYTDLDGGIQPEAVGRDFTGWVSAYTGKPIDEAEMGEWIDDTIETILRCTQGKSLDVLELGTGSGMILFNIVKNLHSYIGLELSRTAVEFAVTTARSIPELAGKVSIIQGTATDLHLLPESSSPDFVVVNSVAQYFPSLDYLSEVVEKTLQLPSVHTIFFGDMRSFALQEEFLITKALCKAGDQVQKSSLRDQVTEMAQAELELLVDPGFFTGLVERYPDRVEHVEAVPKRMNATNELSSYRYTAIIHVKGKQGLEDHPSREIHPIRDGQWIDFLNQNWDKESLLRHLKESDAHLVAVSNIPNSKFIFERHVIDALHAENDNNESDWIAHAREVSRSSPSLSALDIVNLAAQAGYQVEVSCARQHSQRGGLDAVFHLLPPSDNTKPLFQFPTDHFDRPPSTLANQPLQQQARQAIQEQLYEQLEDELEPHLVPAEILVLDRFPTDASGEVDHQALAKKA